MTKDKITKDPMVTLEALLKHEYGVENLEDAKSNLKRIAGRKTKYDYRNKIYPEIVAYVHETGEVDNASKMALDIYERLLTRYGEKNTPPPDTLRTEYIAHIVRRLRFDN